MTTTTLAGLPTLEGYRGEKMIDYDQVKFVGLRCELTADDIAMGVRTDCNNCPVARAIARMFPDCDVSVDSFDIIISRDCIAYGRKFTVSKALRQWISDFDGDEVCEPVKLEIQKDPKKRCREMFKIVG